MTFPPLSVSIYFLHLLVLPGGRGRPLVINGDSDKVNAVLEVASRNFDILDVGEDLTTWLAGDSTSQKVVGIPVGKFEVTVFLARLVLEAFGSGTGWHGDGVGLGEA